MFATVGIWFKSLLLQGRSVEATPKHLIIVDGGYFCIWTCIFVFLYFWARDENPSTIKWQNQVRSCSQSRNIQNEISFSASQPPLAMLTSSRWPSSSSSVSWWWCSIMMLFIWYYVFKLHLVRLKKHKCTSTNLKHRNSLWLSDFSLFSTFNCWFFYVFDNFIQFQILFKLDKGLLLNCKDIITRKV